MKHKVNHIIRWILLLGLLIVAIVLCLWKVKNEHDIPLINQLFKYEELIPNQNIDVTTTLAYVQKDSIYADFRKNFRMHYQTIGLATFPDSSRIILLSEPAPYFNSDTIQTICSKFTHRVEAKIHPIGYDGRVTDILLILANATNENVKNLVKGLSKQLYLSDYKCNTTKLPVDHSRVYFSKASLDYQITLYEFNDWFIENDEQFIQWPDTVHSVSIEQIFQDTISGVFFSKVPGFVAWAMPKNQDLSVHLKDIRQFTLDADLILGAFSDSSTLVVIGRERQTPLYELPPLNVESILLLASVTQKELSQSLDVNDFLAGKMGNGHDWCPTYLSKELENTEFGHLLTITDILLKDWSENGTIQETYYRYPSPSHFPFDKPLFKKLGLSELVYNWNTWNAMYAIDMDEGFTIYTLNRTGALPVSYFNSPERSISIGSRYEKQAYNYFATIGNTDLARVVQYTALYQLFMDNGITYSGDLHASFPANKPYLLLNPTKSVMDFFKTLSDKQIDNLADTFAHRNFVDYQHAQLDKQLRKTEKQYNFTYNEMQLQDITEKVATDERNKLRREIADVKNLLNSLSESDYLLLAKYLSYPRGMRERNQATYRLMLQARKLNHLMRVIGKNNLPIIGLDLKSIKNFYVNQLAKSSSRYLKTPSVIVTFNDFLTTGGHNLSSGITRVHSLSGYKKGNSGRPTYVQATPPQSSPNTSPKSSSPHYNSGSPSSHSSVPSVSKPSSSNFKPNSSSQNIRSRSSVIPSTARVQRGF